MTSSKAHRLPPSLLRLTPFVRWLLPLLRWLSSVQHWIRWKRTKRSANVVIRKSRSFALFYAAWHLIPFSACLVLLVLNTKTYLIGDVSSTQLTALQFAAKLQELIIQTSIANMLFSLVRRQLLGTKGIAFGSLLASLRIEKLSQLWSPDLWGSLTSTHVRIGNRIAIGAAITCAVILASIVGPASAILMIPRPILAYRSQSLIFMDNEAILYPRMFNRDDNRLANESIIMEAMPQLAKSQIHPKGLWDTYGIREMETTDFTVNDQLEVVSTLPPRSMAHALAATAPTDINSATIFTTQCLQPVVYSTCFYQEFLDSEDQEDSYLDFGADNPELNDWIPVAEVLNHTISYKRTISFQNITGIIYFQDVPSEATDKHSILWILAEKTNMTYGHEYTSITPCILDAYWMKSTVNMTGDGGNIGFALDTIVKPRNGSILINTAWANKILSIYNQANGSMEALEPGLILALGMSDATQDFPVFEFPSSPYDSKTEEGGLSEAQVNATEIFFSENNLNYDNLLFGTTMNWTDPRNLTQQVTRYYISNYGYDSTAVTVKLSLVVLSIYSIVAVIFMAEALLVGESSCGWESIGDLVVLALNSNMPGHLGKMSTGIETLAPYKEPVGIRVNGHETLELVFANDSNPKTRWHNCVEKEKAY